MGSPEQALRNRYGIRVDEWQPKPDAHKIQKMLKRLDGLENEDFRDPHEERLNALAFLQNMFGVDEDGPVALSIANSSGCLPAYIRDVTIHRNLKGGAFQGIEVFLDGGTIICVSEDDSQVEVIRQEKI